MSRTHGAYGVIVALVGACSPDLGTSSADSALTEAGCPRSLQMTGVYQNRDGSVLDGKSGDDFALDGLVSVQESELVFCVNQLPVSYTTVVYIVWEGPQVTPDDGIEAAGLISLTAWFEGDWFALDDPLGLGGGSALAGEQCKRGGSLRLFLAAGLVGWSDGAQDPVPVQIYLALGENDEQGQSVGVFEWWGLATIVHDPARCSSPLSTL